MTWKDWINLVAILLGPILAVYASIWLDRRRQIRDRQLSVFRTLVTRRLDIPMEPRVVEALNLVPIDFARGGTGAAKVRAAWGEFMNTLAANSDLTRRTERFVDLVWEMGNLLGYQLDKARLRDFEKSVYFPQGLFDAEEESRNTRRAMYDVLKGNAPIVIKPLMVPTPPTVVASPKIAGAQDAERGSSAVPKTPGV